jgi:cobalt transporter subunit CbtA
MIAKVFAAALAAGAVAACVALVLQMLLTVPLIREAERYETPAPHQHAAASLIQLAHAETAAAPAEAEWQPAEGLQRVALTGVATLTSAVGYALVLLALMLATGSEPTLPRALAWSVGAFAAVGLAPAIGLPPELPGMGEQALGPRQLWWLGTVMGTGLGLYLLAKVRTPLAVAIGLAAIVVPHVIGAPHGDGGGAVPATLAASFAARSIVLSAVFWATLGVALAWAWMRLSRTEPGTAPV